MTVDDRRWTLDDRRWTIDRPARRFVTASDALQVKPVRLEVQILFVPAEGANETP
jgi:hypothetical protein